MATMFILMIALSPTDYEIARAVPSPNTYTSADACQERADEIRAAQQWAWCVETR